MNEKEKSDEFKKERKKETTKCKAGHLMEERKAEMKIDEKTESEEMTTENMKGIGSRKYRKRKQKENGNLDLFHNTRDLWSMKSN